VTRRSRLLAVAGLTAISGLGLTGCQLVEPNIPTPTPSEVDACMGAHEWTLDVTTLASSTQAAMAELGTQADVTVEGSQTLDYTPVVGTLALQSDLTITATLHGTAQVATRTVKGASTGRAFFSGEVAIPRDWDEQSLTVTDAYTDGGTASATPPPWSIPHSWLDDKVGLTTTCTADTLTLQARGTQESWTFHAPGWTPPAPSESATPAP